MKETMRKTIDIFFKFMWNEWDEDICIKIFGWRAEHLWVKWTNKVDDYGFFAAPAVYWGDIDSGAQEAICDYITSIDYKG